MRHDEFKIGEDFYCGDKRWCCTDIGTRVITAICIEVPYEVVIYDPATKTSTHSMSDDPSWFNGPPYGVVEDVFDEYDMPGCHISPDGDDMDEEELERLKRRWQNPSPEARAVKERLRHAATTKWEDLKHKSSPEARALLAKEAHAALERQAEAGPVAGDEDDAPGN